MLVYIEELGNKKSIFSRTIVRQTDLTVNRKTGLETLEAASKTADVVNEPPETSATFPVGVEKA